MNGSLRTPIIYGVHYVVSTESSKSYNPEENNMKWQVVRAHPRTLSSSNGSKPGHFDCTPRTVVFLPQPSVSGQSPVTILKSAPLVLPNAAHNSSVTGSKPKKKQL